MWKSKGLPWPLRVSDEELHPTAALKGEQSPAAKEMEVLGVMPEAPPHSFCWCWGKGRGCLH